MSNKHDSWVTGLFMSRSAAERAVESMLKAGYTHDDLSIILSDKARGAHFPPGALPVAEDKVAGGVGVGGLVGGSVGAVLAGIAAAGTAVIFPGIGLVVAGPILAALAGAGAGGAAGGLVGAIAGAGIPEDRAKLYEMGLRDGGMVVAVKSTSKTQEGKLEAWLTEAGAEKVRAA